MILFVNNDLTDSVQSTLVSQLRISEVVVASEFDQRVAKSPEYPLIIKQNDIHLLVVRSFSDFTNRNLADFVVFCKAGQCSVLSCDGYGAPGVTFPIAHLSLKELRNSFPNCNCWFNTCCATGTFQNNILYPLTCTTCGFVASPFGAACDTLWQKIPNSFNLPVFCRCPGGPFQWLL
jgi:hypothetical protein